MLATTTVVRVQSRTTASLLSSCPHCTVIDKVDGSMNEELSSSLIAIVGYIVGEVAATL